MTYDMTYEELAKHWNCDLAEVKSISDYMNKYYRLLVAQHKETGLYHGVICENRYKEDYIIPEVRVSTNQGFETPKQAAELINSYMDRLKLPEVRAKLMQVPVDAWKALKKIDVSSMETPVASKVPLCGHGRGDR